MHTPEETHQGRPVERMRRDQPVFDSLTTIVALVVGVGGLFYLGSKVLEFLQQYQAVVSAQ